MSTPVNYLSQLLPYEPATKTGGTLKTGLSEYSLLVSLANEAIHSYEAREFEKFDPLVGENCCQVRALRITNLANQCRFMSDELKKSVHFAKTKIADLTNVVDKLSGKGISLQKILIDEKIDVLLSGDELYLVEAFILTLTKVIRVHTIEAPLRSNEITNAKNLQTKGKVSGSFADKLVDKLRVDIAKASVNYVQGLAHDMNVSDSIKLMVSDKFTIEHNHCKTIPFFFCNLVLFQKGIFSHVPIVVEISLLAIDEEYKKIEETALYFKPEGISYKVEDPTFQDLDNAAFFLKGAMARKRIDLPSPVQAQKEFLSYGLQDIFLVSSMMHRQYPDPSLPFPTDEVTYKHYETISPKFGCLEENPSLFFIQHVFCAVVGNSASLRDQVVNATALAPRTALIDQNKYEQAKVV